ncbi:MAG: Re/Si-specific NAD(P)(+) transhydrogenase subunit alpha [Bacteroidetes bacterium]|nr:MAG: Re/Si-specific NAD(P)(+) transhydrogenase subunit alpha [Bacteroidota bacterium]
MKLAVIKESRAGENRVALSPTVAAALIKAGHEVYLESGAGLGSAFPDSAYQAVGVKIGSKADALSQCDMLTHVNPPTADEVGELRNGTSLMSFVYPDLNPGILDALKAKNIAVFAMEAVPRISRAQSMDALSSQANLAGYKAVILGAENLTKIFPLMMTAAGTVTPGRVLIFGAGVAGLQAIATAKRLGAVVEVSDVRPETKEQVESLGGKFIEVKADNAVQVEGGYAKDVSAEFLQKQKEAVEKSLFNADLVITTALVRGGKAPVLISEEQVAKMKFGSVVVDMAVEQGGNCAMSKSGETVEVNGVRIIGALNLPSSLATNASELYAKNIQNLFNQLTNENGLAFDMEDEITAGCLLCGGPIAAGS